ncbi:hypothetical protein, partial [Gilliamella sp. B2828]|uniref:hypothetical protein n=2 Tax=unclassified Gilliamella TaxID=2685620 RepID=UPI00226A710C
NRLQIRILPRVTADIKLYINQNRHLEYFNNLKHGVDDVWQIPNFVGAVYLGAINEGDRIEKNIFNQSVGEQLLIYQNGRLNELVTWHTAVDTSIIFKFNNKLPPNNFTFVFNDNNDDEITTKTSEVKYRYSEAYAVKLNDVYISNVKLHTAGYGCNLSYQAEYIDEIDYQPDDVKTYIGYEVIHNNYTTREISFNQDIDLIDYETGVITRLKKWDKTKLARSLVFYLENLSQITAFKKLIYRLCGRFKPFWLCDETSALIVSFNRENVIYCKYNNDIQISHSAIEHLAIFLDDKVIYTKIVGH